MRLLSVPPPPRPASPRPRPPRLSPAAHTHNTFALAHLHALARLADRLAPRPHCLVVSITRLSSSFCLSHAPLHDCTFSSIPSSSLSPFSLSVHNSCLPLCIPSTPLTNLAPPRRLSSSRRVVLDTLARHFSSSLTLCAITLISLALRDGPRERERGARRKERTERRRAASEKCAARVSGRADSRAGHRKRESDCRTSRWGCRSRYIASLPGSTFLTPSRSLAPRSRPSREPPSRGRPLRRWP